MTETYKSPEVVDAEKVISKLNNLTDEEAKKVNFQETTKEMTQEELNKMLNPSPFTLNDMKNIQDYISDKTINNPQEELKPLQDNLSKIIQSLEEVSKQNLSINDIEIAESFLNFLQMQRVANAVNIDKHDKKLSKIAEAIDTKKSEFLQQTYNDALSSLNNPTDGSRPLYKLLLNPNIDANTTKIIVKKDYTNPWQSYEEKINEIAINHEKPLSELTDTDKKNAVLEVYKEDLKKSFQMALKGMNKLKQINIKINDTEINNIINMLSKDTSGLTLFKLCDFLLKQLNTESFISLESKFDDSKTQRHWFDEKQQQAVKILMRNFLSIEQAYSSILNLNSISNPNVVIEGTEAYNHIPGNFNFYRSDDDMAAKLLEEYEWYKNGDAPNRIRFANTKINYNTINTYVKWHTKTYITNPVDHTNSNNNDISKMFFGTSGAKYGSPSASIQFKDYEKRLETNNKTASEKSILEFVKHRETPFMIITKTIQQNGWTKNVETVIVTNEIYEEYNELMKNSGINVIKWNENRLILKESLETKTNTVGTQLFYRWDTRSEDEKTQELIWNSLSDIMTTIDNLKSNPNIKEESIKVVVSGMASEIPYNGDYKNNEWLAAERARKAKNKINTARGDMPSDIEIIERSSVEGPIYPPNEEMLQEYFPNWDITIDNREKYFDKVEEKIYRDYQKVEISVEYSEITNTGNTDISLDLKRKINNDKIFLMTFDNPWTGKTESNQAKRDDQGSVDRQTTKYVKKQMYNGEF